MYFLNMFLPLVFIFFFLLDSPLYANDTVEIFPLEHYDQTIQNWIKPSDNGYDAPLLDSAVQKKRLEIFYAHYYGELSPWSASYVQRVLQQAAPNDLKTIEQTIILSFSNANKPAEKIGYAENFRPYKNDWITDIAKNIQLDAWNQLSYQSNQRVIATENLNGRALPTEDVHFYDYKIAGQGYPFDNLQNSVLWAGTPAYVITETVDHAWSLVLTPNFIAWVQSHGLARVDDGFVKKWQTFSKNKLIAITHTKTSIIDKKGRFLFSAYVGSVFPSENSMTEIMVPIADAEHNAIMQKVSVPAENVTEMPLPATKHNFANIMQTLIGRPYGWGGMYFYNDCSAELKSLFTPFAIWLPAHSSDQIKEGQWVDMSSAPVEQRLAYLMQNGKPFLTVIYIGGHVVLYIGNYSNPNSADHAMMAMTYQNIWGLRPSSGDKRSVIGQAVLFPMLLQYPEDTRLVSLAAKPYFQVAYLNNLPSVNYLKQTPFIDLKALMSPNN